MSQLKEHFNKLQLDEDSINVKAAMALKQLCEGVKLGRAEFESAFFGITYATWRNYLNPSYRCSRSVAVVAALSWYTGVLTHNYPVGEPFLDHMGLSQEGLRLMVLISQLKGDSFGVACQIAYGLVEDSRKTEIEEYYLKTRALQMESHSIPPFPKPLDFSAFALDYRRSCAIGFCRIQESYGYSDARMASLLGVSEHRFRRLSDPEDDLPVSVYVAIRFRVAFQLEDTTFMLNDMAEFPNYVRTRHYHEARDRALKPLLASLSVEASERLHRALQRLF